MRYFSGFLLSFVMILSGCSAASGVPIAPDAPIPAVSHATLEGRLRGGQQPIAGAHIYLLAANTGGYGGRKIAASSSIASVSLLDPAQTGAADNVGAYVTTDGSGSFSIGGLYTCTPGQQVYAYALGGNPGAGSNAAAGLLAILGECPSTGDFAGSIPFLQINEVTTIAAAYALAGFATDSTHVSTLNAPLASAGLANAFSYAASLATISDGTPVAVSSKTKDVVAVQTINTLANVLAACVNSTGNSPTCNTLFANVDSSTHAAPPAETATAAIYLAQDPYLSASQISSLYDLPSATAPFSPTLGSQPVDFSITHSLSAAAYTSLGDSITCGYVSGQPASDCIPAYAYPSMIASDYNLPLTNASHSGDQACDVWPNQIGPHTITPSLANGSELFTLMIGTNDSDVKGSGSYETTFRLCDSAVVAWQSIPLESKSLAASASLGVGWSQASSRQLGPYITSSIPGSAATFSVSTYGGPVMLWYVFQDANPGEISYSVDGGYPTLLSTQANPSIATQNGSSVSVALATTGALSGSITAPVVHTVTVTNVAGTAYVIGVGTPPMTSFFGHPVLGVANVPADAPGGPLNPTSAAAYSADAQAVATQMQGYGLDVRFGSTHSYLTGQSAEFQFDGLHPNALGATHLSQGLENILQPN